MTRKYQFLLLVLYCLPLTEHQLFTPIRLWFNGFLAFADDLICTRATLITIFTNNLLIWLNYLFYNMCDKTKADGKK